MGWCTDLFCTITFNKQTYNSKYEVEEKIREVEQYLQFAKDRVREFSIMTEPNKFCPEGYDPIIWIRNEIQDTLSDIEEYSVELYRLNMLLDNWKNCHNEEGLALYPPENIKYDTAYLCGDFVKSDKYPTNESLLS